MKWGISPLHPSRCRPEDLLFDPNTAIDLHRTFSEGEEKKGALPSLLPHGR